MVKRILNRSEKQTEEQLSPLATGNGARIFSKIRVADVLEIENSGISAEAFTYALSAHFDFLICDKSDLPLFAVEFDGPSHKRPRQQRNDDLIELALRQAGFAASADKFQPSHEAIQASGSVSLARGDLVHIARL
jgi:hypothetical protein